MDGRRLIFRSHALRRMFERQVDIADIRHITVYEPDPIQWEDGFRRRKP